MLCDKKDNDLISNSLQSKAKKEKVRGVVTVLLCFLHPSVVVQQLTGTKMVEEEHAVVG